jgi:hypothetical protein
MGLANGRVRVGGGLSTSRSEARGPQEGRNIVCAIVNRVIIAVRMKLLRGEEGIKEENRKVGRQP